MIELSPQSFVLAALGLAFGLLIGWLVARRRTHAAEVRLATAEAYDPKPVGHEGHSAFPGLTFLQLLFGYRSLEEIRYAFPDCWANSDQVGMLEALFPKRSSDVWAVS